MSIQLPDITFGPPPKTKPQAPAPAVRGMPGRLAGPATPAPILDITFEPTPRETERQRRLARVAAQFAGVPTPGEAFRAEFVRGVAGQARRVGADLKQRLHAAAEEIAAGTEQLLSGQGSRVMVPPPPRGFGRIALGSLAAQAAPSTALGNVVIPDTMDLLVEGGVPQPVIIAYGTIAQTALDFTADPTFQFLLGRAIPRGAAKLAESGEAATRARATVALRRAIADEVDGLDFHNLPVTRAQVSQQRAALDQALRQADAALARRERVGRVAPVAERPVVLERPPAAPAAGVVPVTAAPRREVIPTPVQRARAATEAAAAATERAEARIGQLPREGGGVVLQPRPPAAAVAVPGAEAVPQRVVPVTQAPRRLLVRTGLTAEEIGELQQHGWTREQIAQMSPQRARQALDEGRALAEREARVNAMRQPPETAAPPAAVPVAEPARPVPVEPIAAPAARARLQVGDEVISARDGNTYRVERVGPRGVGLVDVQTGRRRINVMWPDVPQQLRGVPRGAPAIGRLVETAPTAPELRLTGTEAPAAPVELGRQQSLAELQRTAQTEQMAAAARAKIQARKPQTELTIGEYVRGQGGISIQKSPDLAGELRSLQRQKITPPGLITTKSARSRGADDMAKTLNELGFRKPDGSEISGSDLPRLLEDEYGGNFSKESYLHPASTQRAGMQEEEIVDRQLRTELQARGVLTRRLDEYFDAPRPVKRAIVQALRQAEEQFGRPPVGERDLREFGDLAARIYNTELRGKLAKADQEVLSPKFFHEFYLARDVDPGDVALDIARNEDMHLSERLDEANRYIDEAADALGRRPKLDEQGAIRPHLMGELWDTAVQPVRDLREIVSGFSRGAIRQADGVLKRMGPDGSELVRRSHAVDDTFRLAAGKIEGPLESLRIRYSKAHGAKAWNDLGEKFRLLREGTVPVQLTPEERAIYDVVEHYLGRTPEEGVVGRARAQGLAVGFIGREQPVPGGLGVVEEGATGYWPIRLNFEVAQQRMSEAVAAIMERTHADFERAQQMLFRLLGRQRTGRPFGNLERTRQEWAPYFVRKPAWQEFHEYVYGAERRIAEAKHWGVADERFNELLAAIRQGDLAKRTNNADFASAWFDAITRRAPREVYAESVARKTADLQVASKMVLSVIANATQPANNLLVINTTTFLRAMRKVMSPMTREEALDFARRTGAVLETHMKQLLYEAGAAELGEKVVTKTGFLTVEGGNRLFTAVAGREWAHDLTGMLRKAARGSRRERFIIRHFEQLGLDAETIRAQGFKLTDEQELLAGLKLSDLTQFPINPGTLPLFWSSPWWRLATQFKTFAYKQGVLLGQTILTEARHGNLKPLVIFLTVFPLLGEAVADTRLLLRRLPQSVMDPRAVLAERPQTFLARYAANMAYVGGLGLVSDFARAIERRLPQEAVASFLGGPTFGSELMQAGQAAAAVYQGRIAEGARRLARQLVGLTVTPGLTAAVGIPGALAGEGFESLFITRKALPSRSRQRRTRRTR